MSGLVAQNERRLLQLLADRTTEGLDGETAGELRELRLSHPQYEPEHFDLAAAAIELALSPPIAESLPDRVRDRILMDAGRFVQSSDAQQATHVTGFDQPIGNVVQFPGFRRSNTGWYLAAASLVLAFLGWWQALSGPGSSADPSRQFATFVVEASDLVRAPWVGQKPGFEGVSGEVVWSDSRQHGYMQLVGLKPNDPQDAQYQLWIVDPHRDQRPVDGGVFDVRTDGEVVIPIDAKLAVTNPQMFAITLERPGGVVVSEGPLLVVGTATG